MLVYGVYIISKDGRLIFSEIFQKNDALPNSFILGSLLSTFQLISSEFTGDYPVSLIMGNSISYHFDSYPDYFIIVVSNSNKYPQNLINQLGMSFASEYGDEMINWNGVMDTFYGYTINVLNILQKEATIDMTGKIIPTNRLDLSNYLTLPKKYHDLALILLEHEKISLSKLKQLLQTDTDQELQNILVQLSDLQSLGYVGKKYATEPIYFI